MTCQICKKEIDDHGHLFCSKCRNKPWQKRFKAIAALEGKRMMKWKYRGSRGQPSQKSYNQDYWKRRRGVEIYRQPPEN